MNRVLLAVAAAVVVVTTIPSRAQQQSSTGTQARADVPRVVARVPSALLAVIQGTATRPMQDNVPAAVSSSRTSKTGGLPNTTVRLRDARYGRLVATQITDRTGAFAFRNVEPGPYLVELVGTNQATSATTPLISANAGDIINAVIRQPSTSAAAEQLPLAVAIAQAIPAVVSVTPPTSER
jgi:hypothetical protein